MLFHIDRIPLRLDRQKKLCFFCRYVSCLGVLLRLLIIRIRLRIFSAGSSVIGVALIAHLGDIVAAEPLIRKLREAHPDAYIIWCVGSAYRELADTNPNCDMTLGLRDLSEWIIVQKSGLLTHSLDLHINGRTCLNCRTILQKSTGNPLINLTNYYDFGNLLSIMAQNAGLPIIDDTPALYIPKSVSLATDASGLPTRFICIHCKSNDETRDWDIGKWYELILNLIEIHKIPVIEIGLNPSIPNIKHPLFSSRCGQLSILETADLIRRASAFVGIDSGPAHLANAVGTFGIILLGKYRDFSNHMPFSGTYKNGSNAIIIRHNGPTCDIPVPQVTEALLKYIKANTKFTQVKT